MGDRLECRKTAGAVECGEQETGSGHGQGVEKDSGSFGYRRPIEMVKVHVGISRKTKSNVHEHRAQDQGAAKTYGQEDQENVVGRRLVKVEGGKNMGP